MPSRQIRRWQTDDEYVADQDRESSWSTGSIWGKAAAQKFALFGRSLGPNLFHDDKVADFGGNDGFAAYTFYLEHKVKPLVVDCEPKRLAHARDVYQLPTLQAFIESMPLPDKSIDWGFTSHTLEHTRDTGQALWEMARVVKRGCCFYLPLEDRKHAKANHAHAICFRQPKGWTALLRRSGWTISACEKIHDHEVCIYAEPK